MRRGIEPRYERYGGLPRKKTKKGGVRLLRGSKIM